MTDLKESGRSGKALLSETMITDGNWHRVGLVWDGIYRVLYVWHAPFSCTSCYESILHVFSLS
jgi:hypothetical protein